MTFTNFGFLALTQSRHRARWEGPGGTPGTQRRPMLWPYPPSSTSMGSCWAMLKHGLTKRALSRDFSWSHPGMLHPRAIPGPMPWRVQFGRAHLTETFVLRDFKDSDVDISSWVQHPPRRASNSSLLRIWRSPAASTVAHASSP